MSVEQSRRSRASDGRNPAGAAKAPAGLSPQARREILIDEARKLNAKGMDVAALMEYFDVQATTIRRWLDPAYDNEQRMKTRKRRERYRGTCVICGARTSGSNGAANAPRYCQEHFLLNPDRVVREIWPKKRIIHAIQEWAAIHGEPPGIADWNSTQARALGDEKRAVYFEQNKDIWPWFSHVVRKFGSWNTAIEAAGFTPRAPHGTSKTMVKSWQRRAERSARPKLYWTRERIIQKMHEFNDLYGRPPTSTEWLQPVEIVNGYRIWPTAGGVQKEFGSWSRGIRAAGFKPHTQKKVIAKDLKGKKLRRPPRKWTKEEILDIFRAWVAEHRIPPTKTEWETLPERPSPTTVYEMFGSWNEAVKQAGFLPRPHGVTAAEVRKFLPLRRNL